MNVKIDLNSSKFIQQSVIELKKVQTAEIKKIKDGLAADIKTISEDAKKLRDVDPEQSTATYLNDQINFNLIYYGIAQAGFNVNGSIQKNEKKLELNFNYEFERNVVEDGTSVLKKYSFSLNLKASYEEEKSYSERMEKEDILKFIQKVVNEVFDSFNDERKSLRAVILNQDDVEELAQIDKGEIARMVQTLIGAVISFVKFKEMNNPSNQKTGVVLKPEREKYLIKEFTIKKINSFSVEIKEGETDSNNRNLPAKDYAKES